MSTSPHSNRKGCGLCKPHKIRGQRGGYNHRSPWAVLRRQGRRRRFNRRYVEEA